MSAPYADDHDDYIHGLDGVCDEECAATNHCHGHAECASCGEVFCGCELDEDGLCEDCAAQAEEEEEEA